MFDRQTGDGRETRVAAAHRGPRTRARSTSTASSRARCPTGDPDDAVLRPVRRGSWGISDTSGSTVSPRLAQSHLAHVRAILTRHLGPGPVGAALPGGHPIEQRVGYRYRVHGMHFNATGANVLELASSRLVLNGRAVRSFGLPLSRPRARPWSCRRSRSGSRGRRVTERHDRAGAGCDPVALAVGRREQTGRGAVVGAATEVAVARRVAVAEDVPVAVRSQYPLPVCVDRIETTGEATDTSATAA